MAMYIHALVKSDAPMNYIQMILNRFYQIITTLIVYSYRNVKNHSRYLPALWSPSGITR